MPTRIGIISDTHGLLRPQALDFLRGADRIVHGGDIGPQAILEQLADIAPVTAVRGNNDRAEWCRGLPHSALLRFEGVAVYVVHDVKEIDVDPVERGIAVVVSGHSHKPALVRRDGVAWLNPGSAGPRRFRLPVACAEVLVDGDQVEIRIAELEIPPR